ncbi:hypothetical protein NPIL_460291 [Nephila pilipes]|uniref:Uncharacterized protein n=1 Tax=Nephila pilipes TaxID=299642 RepID=A0A8X6N3H3_NEPPI|nr:hypothetical protein NPIL_460291 [Nephila pilipes]
MAIRGPEFMFARDVIRYVLCEYFTGVNWTPSGIFVHQNHDSPFNNTILEVFNFYLDLFGVSIYEIYEKRFPEKKLSAQQHWEFCKEVIEKSYFSTEAIYSFLNVCAKLSLIATFSFLCGVLDAPDISHRLILRYFETLKSLGLISETFWEEMEEEEEEE